MLVPKLQTCAESMTAFVFVFNGCLDENFNSNFQNYKHLHVQRGVNLFVLFAKHQPGVAGCGWLQQGRNFL